MTVPLATTLSELVGSDVLVHGSEYDGMQEQLFVRFGRRQGSRVAVRLAQSMRSTAPPPPYLTPLEIRLRPWTLSHSTSYAKVWFPAGATIGDLALTRIRPVRAEGLRLWFPPLISKQAPFWLGAAALLLLTVGLTLVPALAIAAVPVGVLAACLPRLRRYVPPQVLGSGSGAATVALGPSPRERVDVVRSEYGRLLSDIVYRIENSALFDAAVEETARFQVALLAWESHPDEPAATEVEDAFRTARTNAQRLGLAHLPVTSQAVAARAAKAARAALRSDSPGERLAAAEAAAGLLRSLALYYLPTIDPTAPSLIGERRSISPRPPEQGYLWSHD